MKMLDNNIEVDKSRSGWHFILGYLWQLIGITLLLSSLACFIFVSQPGLWQYLDVYRFMACLVGVGVFSIFGTKCYRRGRKYTMFSAVELLSRDSRPPVLYLRSFIDDSISAKIISPYETALRSLYTGSNPIFIVSEEEQIAKVLNEFGPSIAIGKPGETLPELGMARLYVSDDEWQETVVNLMRRSRLVAIRLGETEGLWWEVQQAVKYLKPHQLIFLIPYESEESLSIIQNTWSQYGRFCKKLKETIGCDLPLFYGKKVFGGDLSGIIFFDYNWTPDIVALDTIRIPFLRKNNGSPLIPILRIALRPVFMRLKGKWNPPSLQWWKIFGIAYLIFIVALMVSRIFL